MKIEFTVKGTHCPSCAALIQDVCSDYPAILSCNVDFTTGRVVLEHTDQLDWNALKKEIEALGDYTVQTDLV